MYLNSIWSALISFVVAFIITWLVLSTVLIWVNPDFFNDDGSLNWVTTLWVAILIVLLTYVFLFLIYIIFYFIMAYVTCDNPCEEKMVEAPCFPAKRTYKL